MCQVRAIITLTITLLCTCLGSASAQERLVIATRENALTNRFAEDVLTRAYDRIGYQVEFIRYPDARSVIEANKGRADGEAARLSVVLKTYTDLRKVPIPLFHSELSAFTHSGHNLDVTTWESLGQYNIATIQGFKFVQNKLKTFSPSIFPTSDDVIQRIEAERIEVGVLNRFLGLLAAKRLKTAFVRDVSPPLARLPVYHLVHKRHEQLIPKLTGALHDMQDSGELKGLWESFVAQELSKAGL